MCMHYVHSLALHCQIDLLQPAATWRKTCLLTYFRIYTWNASIKYLTKPKTRLGLSWGKLGKLGWIVLLGGYTVFYVSAYLHMYAVCISIGYLSNSHHYRGWILLRQWRSGHICLMMLHLVSTHRLYDWAIFKELTYWATLELHHD